MLTSLFFPCKINTNKTTNPLVELCTCNRWPPTLVHCLNEGWWQTKISLDPPTFSPEINSGYAHAYYLRVCSNVSITEPVDLHRLGSIRMIHINTADTYTSEIYQHN